jgi:hypothetical protein
MESWKLTFQIAHKHQATLRKMRRYIVETKITNRPWNHTATNKIVPSQATSSLVTLSSWNWINCPHHLTHFFRVVAVKESMITARNKLTCNYKNSNVQFLLQENTPSPCRSWNFWRRLIQSIHSHCERISLGNSFRWLNFSPSCYE